MARLIMTTVVFVPVAIPLVALAQEDTAARLYDTIESHAAMAKVKDWVSECLLTE